MGHFYQFTLLGKHALWDCMYVCMYFDVLVSCIYSELFLYGHASQYDPRILTDLIIHSPFFRFFLSSCVSLFGCGGFESPKLLVVF